MVAPLRPSTGTGFGIHRRGTRSDQRHQTHLSHETGKEIGGRTSATVDFPARVDRRNRLHRHGTGTIDGLAGSIYWRERAARTASDCDASEACTAKACCTGNAIRAARNSLRTGACCSNRSGTGTRCSGSPCTSSIHRNAFTGASRRIVSHVRRRPKSDGHRQPDHSR